MKILIGYDGSECSQAALRDLRRAGLPPAAEALVISVGETFLPPPPPSSYEIVDSALSRRVASAQAQAEAQASKILEEAHEQASVAVERLRADFPSWEMSAEAAAGNPAWALVQRAEEWGAELVVVGSQGRTALGRILLGSVSSKVANEARCSVRVARCPVEREGTAARILVGFDGSDHSRLTVRTVGRRSWAPGTEARLVWVRSPRSSGLLHAPSAADSATSPFEEAETARAAERAAEDLRAAAGLRVSIAAPEGDPKSVLISEAKEFDAGCIYVGSRGFNSRVERWVLGSVSASLVKNAHCSVEVVREGTLPAERVVDA